MEAIVCVSNPGNTHDQYTVPVRKNLTITLKVHLLQKVSLVPTLFLKRGSPIHCRVAGRQRYSVVLLQRSVGVELRFSGIIFHGALIFVNSGLHCRGACSELSYTMYYRSILYIHTVQASTAWFAH